MITDVQYYKSFSQNVSINRTHFFRQISVNVNLCIFGGQINNPNPGTSVHFWKPDRNIGTGVSTNFPQCDPFGAKLKFQIPNSKFQPGIHSRQLAVGSWQKLK
ncbi:MAG: hypothetical protein EA359_14120 [Balneolaceae bacterium]|nr:MAG: hypothetical protein EA359_14120 [Balneolaceae bacterium]